MNKETLYINYHPSGKAIPDHEVEEFLLEASSKCVNGINVTLDISTENVVNCVRALWLQEKITCKIGILFIGKEIPMNEFGRLEDCPKGFCDYNDNWIVICLKEAIKKHEIRNHIIL